MSKGKESNDVRVWIKEMGNVNEAASVDSKQNELEMNVWVQRHRDLFRRCEVMQEEGASSTENNVMIYCLPEFMMRSVECKRWFVPEVTSIGPLHFRCSDGVGVVSMGAVARIKEEAISFIMEKYGDAECQRITESLISDIRGHEQEIKACYSDGTRIPVFLSGDPFAWMMVVDACYLLVALSLLSQKTIVESKRWPALALLQEEGYRHQKVVHDLLKIENQIPLWVVRRVATHLPGWVPSSNEELSPLVDMRKVLQRLSPFSSSDLLDVMLKVFSEAVVTRWRGCYNDHRGTLLDTLLSFSLGMDIDSLGMDIVSPTGGEPSSPSPPFLGVDIVTATGGEPSSPPLPPLLKLLVRPISDLLDLLRKIFHVMDLRSLTARSVLPFQWEPFNLVVNLVTLPVQLSFVVLAIVVVAMGTVLLALAALPFMVVASIWEPRSSVHTVNLGAHAVIESGVKMNMSTTALGIQSAVYWREEGGQLGLPRICLDELAMVALWNMVALEHLLLPKLASRQTPLCSYVFLMSDLLGSADDVMCLENERIIEHVVSSRKDDVVRMWQDLKLSATTANAHAHRDDKDIITLEDERRGASLSNSDPILYAHTLLSKFVDSRQHPSSGVRRLEYWINVLRSNYGSSPWLAISTVGAIALLLMTVAQVFCLFYQCPGTKG